MTSDPLVLAGHFGPFILRGRRNRHSTEARFSTMQRQIYVLVAIESGLVEVHGDGRPQAIPGPSAFLLQPDSPLSISGNRGTAWGELVFQLMHAPRHRGAHHRSWIAKGDRQPGAAEVFGVDLPPMVPPQLAQQALATVALAEGSYYKSPLQHARANALLGRWLLDYAWAMQDEDAGCAATDPLRRAENHARSHLDAGCSVADMAQVAGLSRAHFGAIYRAATGRTPRRFLDDLRLERACRELATGTDIVHSAKRCGFRSPTSFTAFFKRQTGMTPSRWQREHR